MNLVNFFRSQIRDSPGFSHCFCLYYTSSLFVFLDIILGQTLQHFHPLFSQLMRRRLHFKQPFFICKLKPTNSFHFDVLLNFQFTCLFPCSAQDFWCLLYQGFPSVSTSLFAKLFPFYLRNFSKILLAWKHITPNFLPSLSPWSTFLNISNIYASLPFLVANQKVWTLFRDYSFVIQCLFILSNAEILLLLLKGLFPLFSTNKIIYC